MVKKNKRETKQQRFPWPTGDQTKFALLVVSVACQLATIAITWSLWEARETPIHLPMLPLPAFPFGLLLVASLLFTLLQPRIGVCITGALLAVACCFDQLRIQPQVFTPFLLTAAIAFEPCQRFGRWYLAAMWFWAGLHKLVSASWWTTGSFYLLARLGPDIAHAHVAFAAVVALSELLLGLFALFKPKWAAFGCVALHVGIALFLSPIGANWNCSVIPWNLATAIVGCWLLRNQFTDLKRWEIATAGVLLVIPAGFYVGVTTPYFAHVLYSGGAPRAMFSSQADAREIVGWDELAVPFPQQRRLYLQYFRQLALPGDKLHIADPRAFFSDLYLEMQPNGAIAEITAEDFVTAKQPGGVRGSFIENRNDILALSLAHVEMRSRHASAPVFAVVFTAENYHPDLLQHLSGLPNIEQIQLSGTSVADDDLRALQPLHRLVGLGLNNTKITDRGVFMLKENLQLRVIECEGTAISQDALKQVLK